MNPNYNPPLYSPPPAQNFGYCPADYGCNAPANMPSNMTSHYSDSDVARLLLQNFDSFSPNRGFITRRDIENMASRSLGLSAHDDQMTLLARDILGRDGLPSLFDGVQNGGREDGLINREDMQAAIDQLDPQGARGYQSPGYNGAMQPPPSEFGRRYNGAMQQQRVNQQFSPQFCAPPSSGGPRGMEGWDALPPAPRLYAAQPPSYGGTPVIQQWNPMMAGGRPYANEGDVSLTAKALSHFSDLQDPSTGTITDASLSAAASGYSLDGRPISTAATAIAQELQERGQLFKTLDQGRSGTLDGSISRQDLGDGASKYREMDNVRFLQAVKGSFRQFAAGADDKYVNVNELKEAAGLIPSDRTFSPQAREVALELLRREDLFRALDIGVREEGKPGAEDQRFDEVNIDFMIEKEIAAQRAKPYASASVGNYSVAAGG